MLSETTVVSAQQRALRNALLGLLAAAGWDVASARSYSREALRATAVPASAEPLNEMHYRQVARLVAAVTCMMIGDASRGRRALSNRFDPDHRFLDSIGPSGVDVSSVPALFRGYARVINEAFAAARRNRPPCNLTPAELQVLRLLPEGQTLREVAAELGKSKKTIERQVDSIYTKLYASTRAQAIQRARQAGILS
jgi:DNA-binding NarL/FixJ family response regulator